MSCIGLIAGNAHPELGRDMASAMGARLIPMEISAFADGETRIRIEAGIFGIDLYIVQPTSTPTNEHLMTLALIADAARAAGAARVTAVIPYFGYARQDVRQNSGEPLSARLAAKILHCAGIDRVVTLELHSPALENAFQMPLLHLCADQLMLPVIRNWNLPGLVIVSPDAGGFKRAQRYATALASPLAVVAKSRPSADVTLTLQTLGEVRNRPCLIVDDMASTGGTIAAATALLDAGAKEVHAFFIHAVMAPGALDRICAASVRRIVTTDSVRSIADPRIDVVPIAWFLTQALTQNRLPQYWQSAAQALPN